MARFHVNPKTGETGKCKADVSCPFGGDQVHGATRDDARMLYEQYVANDTDPRTNQFSEHSKKEDLEAKLADVEKRGAFLSKINDFLQDEPMKIAVSAGLVTAALLGGGLAHHTATQDYTPVETQVVSSKVDVDYVPVKVGKVTTIQKHTSTDYVLKTDSGQIVKVTQGGEQHPEPNASKVVFQTGENDFTAMKPGSGEAYFTAGAIGAMGGVAASVAAMFATLPASDLTQKKVDANRSEYYRVREAMRA